MRRDLSEAMKQLGRSETEAKEMLDKADLSRDLSVLLSQARKQLGSSEAEFLSKFLQLCNMEPAQVV